ncbi:hypothetical protein OG863_37300 [Streptomyces decoyicus]|uniref:Uncharacterized protein n=1 Tax=Streptomyces decoyicus TaxID=249567 RepID=A0ABZ1FRS3_9ACTN|nr:hypothetical protein [Streptomyces decoyicus]WSB73168.1 hypothetical protein OG863_37300 [Streptomyces decoyicus]
MPPECAACTQPTIRKHNPSGKFTVVYFHSTVEYPDDWTGHPENAVWFCAEHLPLTEGLTHLTALEAIDRIRAQLPQVKA